MACRLAEVACGTTEWMRCGVEATWQGRGWPAQGIGGAQDADTWQEATGSTRTPVWGATWREGSQVKGPRDSGPW